MKSRQQRLIKIIITSILVVVFYQMFTAVFTEEIAAKHEEHTFGRVLTSDVKRVESFEKNSDYSDMDLMEDDEKEEMNNLKAEGEAENANDDDAGDEADIELPNHSENVAEKIADDELLAYNRKLLVERKLALVSRLARDTQVPAVNITRSKHGRSLTTICSSYVLEGSHAFHTGRQTFPNVWSQYNTNSTDKMGVTFITQMTLRRLNVLELVAQHWSGPISVSIHVTAEEFPNLDQYFTKYTRLLERDNIDVHFVAEKGEFYPVNYLRNIALDNSKTDYVFLSDVDFVPSYNIYEALLSYTSKGDANDTHVLVVPAYQFMKSPVPKYPASKSEALSLAVKNKLKPFHYHFKPGHRKTKFSTWAVTSTPYEIDWEDGFEPYIVAKKSAIPKYKDTFLGRIRNKTQHITHIYYLGLKFVVLPDVFTIHMPHKASKGVYYHMCSLSKYRVFVRRLQAEKLKRDRIAEREKRLVRV